MVDVFIAIRFPVVTCMVLSEVAMISPMFVNPISLPIKSESTIKDDIYACPTLIELNVASNADVVLVVRRLIKKLLANPALVDMTTVEILLAVKIPVLRRVVLRIGGTIEMPPPPLIPVRPDPSPTNLA